MKHLALMAFAVALTSPLVAQGVNTNTPAGVTLVISGTIKNFDALAPHVTPETYLQLVPIPADGILWAINKFKDGKTVATLFDSRLEKLPFPKKAVFVLNMANIAPGKYLLAAQQTTIHWSTAAEGPLFLTDKNAMFVIDVPADAKSPHAVNAGDLVVRIHHY